MPLKKSRETRRNKQTNTVSIGIDEDDGTQVESRPGKKRTTKQRKTRRVPNRHPLDDSKAQSLLREFCLETIKKGVPGLKKEFDDIKKETYAPPAMNAFTANKPNEKNRYGDVFCNDATRVILRWPPGANDYIHANWIDYRDKRSFICTQGPTEKSVDDFWRLIWQERCQSIIMLCEIMEQGRRKCEPYWPAEEGAEMRTKIGLTIKNTGIEQHEEKSLTVVKLEVTNGTESLVLKHLKWNDWPDRSAPKNKLAPFRLLHRVTGLEPVVVHCSAGIGRTGTVVALYMALQDLTAKSPLNTKTLVKELRARRHGSVQMDIQYVYIHRSLIALAENKKVISSDEAEQFYSQYDQMV